MDEEAVLQDVAQKWSEPEWEKSLKKEVQPGPDSTHCLHLIERCEHHGYNGITSVFVFELLGKDLLSIWD